MKFGGNTEKLLYIISNECGEIPREGVSFYAEPISKKIQTALDEGSINLESEEDLDSFVSQLQKVQRIRNSAINFLNIGEEEKNTIEFRMPNSSTNPQTWIENVNLFGGIVKAAHELTLIQEKNEADRTEAEKKMLESLEIIQTQENQEEVLKALLELTISSGQRQVYMDRYNVNQALLAGTQIEGTLINRISTEKIGKKAIVGKNATDGVNYAKGSSIIEGNLKQSLIKSGQKTMEGLC